MAAHERQLRKHAKLFRRVVEKGNAAFTRRSQSRLASVSGDQSLNSFVILHRKETFDPYELGRPGPIEWEHFLAKAVLTHKVS
jgi:hypothetical protein